MFSPPFNWFRFFFYQLNLRNCGPFDCVARLYRRVAKAGTSAVCSDASLAGVHIINSALFFIPFICTMHSNPSHKLGTHLLNQRPSSVTLYPSWLASAGPELSDSRGSGRKHEILELSHRLQRKHSPLQSSDSSVSFLRFPPFLEIWYLNLFHSAEQKSSAAISIPAHIPSALVPVSTILLPR